MDTMMFIIILILIIFIVLIIIGKIIWNVNSQNILSQLHYKSSPDIKKIFDLNALTKLPKPVQRYLTKVIPQEQYLIKSVELKQEGLFNLGKNDKWFKFRASQKNIINSQDFFWNARIQIFPGINFYVYDYFIRKIGGLKVKLLGLFTIIDKKGGFKMNMSEFIRFLAESPLYPTFMFSNKNTTWKSISDSTAMMQYNDGHISSDLIFTFDKNDMIERIQCNDRGRLVGDSVVPTVWIGQWRNYQKHNGFIIPTEGEISWIINDSTFTYWKGRITEITFDF